MIWRGCTNPYLLPRGHRLHFYGVADWETRQPALAEDNFDFTLMSFTAALDASWNEWIDCIDLLGVTDLERQTWRLRAHPGAYISLPKKQRKRSANNFI